MKKLLSLFTALLLCTAMWGATYKTFYKVQGALYQGINVDFTTNKNMFVPNGATVTYSTFDGQPADWYSNGNPKKSGSSFYTASNLADASYYKYQIKNYTGYDAQDPKIDYIYGTSSGDYLLRAGSGTMYMMSMANAYAVCTEDSKTPTNVGKYTVVSRTESGSDTYKSKYGTYMMYGTKFNHTTYGAVKAYEMLVDNPGEMYIDYIVLPIFGYPKTDETTIEKMIPEKAELTLTLYSIDLTLATDGKYSYTRKTTPITTVTATADNFTADGDNLYRGTVKFTPENPLLISGDFVAHLTWDDGCDFGLITDNYNLQNYTTWYIFGSVSTTMWTGGGYNASISYHAMFPVLEKKDKIETLEFASTGEESKEVAIKSNINPSTSKDFTIDFGGADWISMTEITYSDGEYKLSGTNTLTFKAEANDGDARSTTITLKHHLKELTYTVKQAPMIKSISIKDSESKEISALSLKATETATLTATISPTETDQTSITWSVDKQDVASIASKSGGGITVTAESAGTAIITAKSVANETIFATCTVTVTPKVETHNVPKSNLIAPSTAEGNVQFTNDNTNYYKQIQYNITGKNFVDADWTVTFSEGCDWVEYKFLHDQNYPNRAIITLKTTKSNQTGSNRSGNVTIKAYGYEFNYSITQAPMINKIVGFADAISLKKGDVTDLTATILPANTDQDKSLSWTTDDKNVAAIALSENGGITVTAVAPGTATITAKSKVNSTITKTCTVTVYEVTKKDPSTTTLTAPAAGDGTKVTFTLLGADFNDANWSVTEKPDWISETAFTSKKEGNSTTVTCTLTADANATVNKRSGTIKIQVFGGKYEFEYTITQEPMQSAFYNLPEGAFGCGMTTTGGLPVPYIVAPYIPGKDIVWTSTTGAGKWTVNSDILENSDTYTMSNVSMKGEYNIPMLEQEGKRKFQFGIQSEETYRTNTKFRVGDPVARYITPALMFTDLASRSSGQAHTLMVNYKTTERDVMGVYFNNTDVMYIDGISIPIKNNTTGATVDDMFPNDAHVIVNIYKATSISGKDGNEADKDNPLWTGTLTRARYSDETSTTGALNVTFGKDEFPGPISIDGPFVVELSDMKNSECNFYVYSSQVHSGTNEWGYYIKDDVETYPGDYTLAVSVHAMFPALYPNDDADLSIEISADGGTVERTVFANCKYVEGSDWNLSVPEGIGLSVAAVSKNDEETTLSFTMGANTTGEERKVDVTFTFRGKTLTYHVTQPALEPTAYTRPVTSGNWGTICLPYAAASFSGAEMYSIAGKMEGETGIYLDQVSTMEAGEPYIFRATDDKIEVKYYAIGDPQAANENAKGLCGYIGESEESYITVPEDGNSYIVYQNALYLVNSENVTIASNRAYIKYNKVGTPSPAPHVHRVAMPISGAPTSLLQVNEAQPAVKILRDGHIVILRADKEYNILGQSK